MSEDVKRIIFASIAVVFSSFLVTLLLCLPDHFAQDVYSFSMVFLIASVASLIALVVTVIWAIPMHCILSKYKFESCGWYLLLAVISSCVFIFLFKPFGHDKASDLIIQTILCSFVGSVGAFLFWYIVVYKQRIKR